jgi:hypothetical protein
MQMASLCGPHMTDHQENLLIAKIAWCSELMIATLAMDDGERLGSARIDEVLKVGRDMQVLLRRCRAACRALSLADAEQRLCAQQACDRRCRLGDLVVGCGVSRRVAPGRALGGAVDDGGSDAVPQVLLQQLQCEGLQGLGAG